MYLSRQKALRGRFSNRIILGHFSHRSQFPQVFISGTKSECKRLLQTILQNRRLCTLLSPYFTPVASPSEFVTLYEKVVAFLSEDNSDVVFMLLTKVKYSLRLFCGYSFPKDSDFRLRKKEVQIWYLKITLTGSIDLCCSA